VVNYIKELGSKFNAIKFATKKMEIGSEGTLSTDAKGTYYATENFVKVGEDQFIAQGLGDGPMTFKQMQEALVGSAKTLNNEKIKTSDVQLIQIRETGADVKHE
jgi:hypothetical protein